MSVFDRHATEIPRRTTGKRAPNQAAAQAPNAGSRAVDTRGSPALSCCHKATTKIHTDQHGTVAPCPQHKNRHSVRCYGGGLGRELVDPAEHRPAEASVLPTLAQDNFASGLENDPSAGCQSVAALHHVVLLASSSVQELRALETDARLRMHAQPYELVLRVGTPSAPARRDQLCLIVVDGNLWRAHRRTSVS